MLGLVRQRALLCKSLHEPEGSQEPGKRNCLPKKKERGEGRGEKREYVFLQCVLSLQAAAMTLGAFPMEPVLLLRVGKGGCGDIFTDQSFRVPALNQ